MDYRTPALRLLATLLLCVACSAHALAAQQIRSPVTTTTALVPDEAWVAERSATLETELQQPVREAFAALARARQDGQAARTARRTFERLVDTRHAPLGRLGLGLLDAQEALDPESYGRGVGAVVDAVEYMAGASPAHYARLHLLRAIQTDPTLDVAATALVEIELAMRKDSTMRVTHALLSSIPSRRPAFLRARLELANAIGALDDAAELAAVAMGAADAADAADAAGAAGVPDTTAATGAVTDGAPCGDPRLMRSLAEATLRRNATTDGAALYMRAVNCMDDEAAPRFLADMRLLLEPSEQQAWRDGSLEDRRQLLRTAWEWRAADAGVALHTRLAEHFRRLSEAYAEYSFFPPSTKAMGTPGYQVNPHTGDALGTLDQRAELLVRHGRPDRVVSSRAFSPGGGLPSSSNESWYYLKGGEKMVFHLFSEGEKFTLGGLPGCMSQGWYDERGALETQLGMIGQRCRAPGRGGADMNRITAQGYQANLRKTYATAMRTQSQRVFTTAMPFHYEMYRLAGASGMTDLVAAIGVPAASLPVVPAAGGYMYRLDASLIVVDSVTRAVHRMDTTVSVTTARRLGAGDLLRAHLQIPVAPSEHTSYRIIVRNPADERQGEGYGGPLAMTRFDAGTITISDIVLAEPNPVGTWRRGDEYFSLVPFQEFPGGEFDLFYEVYGLPADARIRTNIRLVQQRSALRTLFGGAKPIELSFTDAVEPDDAGTLRERRRLEASSEPGDYLLTVTVQDLVSGRTVEQHRRFRITAANAPAARE